MQRNQAVHEHHTVEKMEEKVEEPIAEVIVKMGLKKLLLLPSRHTFQMMAKAAVENQRPEK